ncbi:MAG: hypothetical protein EPO06_07545 [Burkholderiaceae bacterium]|nr:MAG: hypothetical protein EPO06_07545 [Burkholderiaceae bacterium]
MTQTLRRCLPLLALLLSATASAQRIFVCKDPVTGHTLTSDRPIPECSQSTVRELRKDGSTLRVIPPPLTAAERQAKEEETARLKQEEIAQAEQKRRDQVLLASYTNEAALEEARARQVEPLQDDIKHAQQRLELAQKELASAQQDAKPYGKKPLPFGIQQRLMRSDASIKGEQTVIDSKRGEIDKTNKKFDEDRARFRILTGKN